VTRLFLLSASHSKIILVLCATFFLGILADARLVGAQGGGEPGRNGPGPWDNDVVVYRVGGGGEAEKVATFERAGVPTVARLKDGRLMAAFQHFPQEDNRNFDRVAVRFSSDEGRSWSK